jgi:dTDP-glucose pyrophosphorylase
MIMKNLVENKSLSTLRELIVSDISSLISNEFSKLVKNEISLAIKSELSEAKESNESPKQTNWLTTQQVKDLLQVSDSTLQTLRTNNTLQYSKIGGKLYYKSEHINSLFENGEK